MSEVELGKAVIPIRATLEKLDKDLEDAKRKAEAASGGIAQKLEKHWGDAAENINRSLSKVALVGMAALTAAAAGASAALVKLTTDAIPLASIEAAFRGIAGGGDEMLASLRASSQGMISDIELMRSYNQAAQLVSVTFANQLPEAMGYLAKVAAATGQDMNYMLDSLVRGVGRLSPLILDNLGIQVNLTEANERYAQSIGKSADQLSKTEQQTALMNAAMEKLAANTANMPAVSGSAQAGWAQFHATLENLTNGIGMALLPIFNRIMEVLNRVASSLTPVVDAFRVMGQAIATELDNLLFSARGWGEGIGASLAQGIYDAIPYVVAAMRVIGDIISYWLSPGSPPRIVPDLDKWGTEAARVYMDGWRRVDYSVFDFMSDQLEVELKRMVEVGSLTPDEFVSTMLGSRQEIATALAELTEKGAISEEAVARAEAAAGPMGKEVRRLLEALSATGGEEKAVAALLDTERQLARWRADNLRLQEEGVKMAEKMAAAADRAAAATRGGNERGGMGDAERAAQAQWNYNYAMANTAGKLEMMRARLADTTEGSEEYYNALLKIAQLEDTIQDEEKRAAEDKRRVDEQARKAAERVAEAEWNYRFAIADTATQIAMMEEKIAGTDQGTVEYYDTALQLQRLQEKLADEQQRAADEKARADERALKDAQAVVDAEWQYRYSLEDTAGKLEMMREKLGTVEEGSVEYYRILTDIAALERQQVLEQERADKQGTGAIERLRDLGDAAAEAQWRYNYSIADTQGKLEMLREKLSTVEEGSAEYWNIMTQIAALEKELAKGTGIDTLSANIVTKSGEIKTAMESAFDLTQIDAKAEEIRTAVMENLAPAMEWLKENGPVIGDIARGIGVALGVAAIASTLTGIAGAIGFLVTPLGLVSLAVAALALAWANWDDIKDWCDSTGEKIKTWSEDTYGRLNEWKDDTWDKIQEWIRDTSGKYTEWRDNNAATISGWASDTWESIKTWCNDVGTKISDTWSSVETTVSGVVGSLWDEHIEKPLAALKTKWEEFWNGIKKFVSDTMQNLKVPVPHVSVNWDWQEIIAGRGVWIPNIDVQWYGRGGDFLVNQPTLIGVGERGIERVQITPVGDNQAANKTETIYNMTINYRDQESESDLYHTIRALQMAGA